MPGYDIAFAEKISSLANMVLADGIEDAEAKRMVLYLSLLSTEISLKAMLEKAGHPVAEIRRRSHNLAKLVNDLSRCNIYVEISPSQCQAFPASRRRAKLLSHGGAAITVGAIKGTEPHKASRYPNQVRYGAQLRHYPPDVTVQLASTVVEFAKKNWASLHMR